MSGKLAEIEARIGSVEQLAVVISAMRGIAAARTAEAGRHLEGIRTYAGAVAHAIGQALAVTAAPAGGEAAAGPQAIVAFCAEQGFAGSFSARILERAASLSAADTVILIVGDRGLAAAAEKGIVPDWSQPMVSSVEQVTLLANRVMDALYERIDAGTVRSVRLVHARPSASSVLDIVAKRLIPFDFSGFPAIGNGEPPLLTLPPRDLLASLVEEYVFAELCEAAILSFAAENEARMHAMVAAQQNVSDTLDGLVSASQRQRQEEITNEIGELSASILST